MLCDRNSKIDELRAGKNTHAPKLWPCCGKELCPLLANFYSDKLSIRRIDQQLKGPVTKNFKAYFIQCRGSKLSLVAPGNCH